MVCNLVRNLFILQHFSAFQYTGTIKKGKAFSGSLAGINRSACLSSVDFMPFYKSGRFGPITVSLLIMQKP